MINILFGEVMGERIIWDLGADIWSLIHDQVYKNMASSKGVHTYHLIHMFIFRSMVLKIHSNAGQMPGTTSEGKKKIIRLSMKGGPFDC